MDRHHVKACAPQKVTLKCQPDHMELSFPAAAVGGSQEQVLERAPIILLSSYMS